MIEVLLDDNILGVCISHVIGLIALLSGKVYLSSSLTSVVSTTTSSTVVIVIIPLRSLPRVLLESFRHTVFLEMVYLIAPPTSNIDAAFWSGCQILFFLSLE